MMLKGTNMKSFSLAQKNAFTGLLVSSLLSTGSVLATGCVANPVSLSQLDAGEASDAGKAMSEDAGKKKSEDADKAPSEDAGKTTPDAGKTMTSSSDSGSVDGKDASSKGPEPTGISVGTAVLDPGFSAHVSGGAATNIAVGTVTAVNPNGTFAVAFTTLYFTTSTAVWTWGGDGTCPNNHWIGGDCSSGTNLATLTASDFVLSASCIQGVSVGNSFTLGKGIVLGDATNATVKGLWTSGGGSSYVLLSTSGGTNPQNNLMTTLSDAQLAIVAKPGYVCPAGSSWTAPSDAGADGAPITVETCDPSTNICFGARVLDLNFNPGINANTYYGVGDVVAVYSDGSTHVSYTSAYSKTDGTTLSWSNGAWVSGSSSTPSSTPFIGTVAASALLQSTPCFKGINANSTVTLGSSDQIKITALWTNSSGGAYATATSSAGVSVMALSSEQIAILTKIDGGGTCLTPTASDAGSDAK